MHIWKNQMSKGTVSGILSVAMAAGMTVGCGKSLATDQTTSSQAIGTQSPEVQTWSPAEELAATIQAENEKLQLKISEQERQLGIEIEVQGEETPALKNLFETATAAGDFKVLTAALSITGLTETVSTGGPFTVFAPNDSAFYALGTSTLNDLFNAPEQLKSILLYHVVSGKFFSSDVAAVDSVTTVVGADLILNVSNGELVVGQDSNGIALDIEASNGVIHVIDSVLSPSEDGDLPLPSILEIAEEAGSFTILLEALRITGLDQAIARAEDITVFAPSDVAFRALPEGVLESLIADPHALADVLKLHVGVKAVSLHDLQAFDGIQTLSGQVLRIGRSQNYVTVGNAQIAQGDVNASNGVIHILNSVITDAH